MKYKSLAFLFLILFIAGFIKNAFSWGFWAHKRINHQAVFSLPQSMLPFYKNHIEYITKHATDPDIRRYKSLDEAQRHFINPERFNIPIDSIPEHWKDAVDIFSEDSLQEYGIVPWYINEMTYRLTDAFKAKDVDKILKLSADIGHYIADANVPLHCTLNYNGQQTNQEGIHAFWESRIPELFGDNYDFFVGNAIYIKHPLKTAWNIVKESYNAKDSVLTFEKRLSDNYPSDKKFSIETRNKKIVKVYSIEYSKAYNEMLGGMIERRMRSAILMVSSYWYTAWVNAGQPDLSSIENKEPSIELINQLKQEELDSKSGKAPNKGHVD